LRVVSARVRASLAALLVAVLTILLLPGISLAHAYGIDRFMAATAKVESGGDYYAVNPVSGAYGKYQILPSNWPAWAEKYLGDASAKPTPENQEIVARAKFHDLYHWLGAWRQVSYWWLTGRDGRTVSPWSSAATTYVNKVMTYYWASADTAGTISDRTVIGDGYASVHYTGRWNMASHTGYIGGKVHYSTARGATASLTFTGRTIAWYGPTGPTRGRAKVLIDGTAVATVDLRASAFHPKEIVFSKRFATTGRHTITIVVLGTAGRPNVSIDAFVVRS
jgi:hypothetical protein